MKRYEVSLDIEDTIEAETEEEAKKIFWDRFENSVWNLSVIEIE